MNRKTFLCTALLCFATLEMVAGGLFTSNNQNPVFFRQPAQNAVVGVQGAYYNPAGLVFMNEGWHIGIGDQMANQSRQITSEYQPFALNVNNASSTERFYKGSTFSPIIPSLDISYNRNKWAVSTHFGVISGGGKCEFTEGLGSFEAPMALLPTAVNMIAGSNMFGGYDADIHFTGASYGFAGQFNFSYKLIDGENSKLSVAAGIRLNYLMNKYSGGIFGYQLKMGANMVPATAAITGFLGQLGIPAVAGEAIAKQMGGDKEVSCKQDAFALNPIFSLHYAVGAWNFALRYEALTKASLKNKTAINTAGIAQFNDGVESRSDIPALVSGGFNVDILPQWRGGVGFNLYCDKGADYGGKQDKLGRNTIEFLLGTEYDLSEKWTVSIGSQITSFDFGENNDYLTDMSFSLPSWCLGGGFRYHFTDNLAIDLSVFKTNYSKADKKYSDYGNAGATYKAALGQLGLPEAVLSKLAVPGNDEFYRTSVSWGIGLVWDL